MNSEQRELWVNGVQVILPLWAGLKRIGKNDAFKTVFEIDARYGPNDGTDAITLIQ